MRSSWDWWYLLALLHTAYSIPFWKAEILLTSESESQQQCLPQVLEKALMSLMQKKKTKKNISCLWRYQRLAVDKLFLPPCTYKQVCRDTGWQTNLLSTSKSSRFQNTGTNVHSSRYSVFREWDTAWKTNTEWITVHTTHVIWASWVWETLHTSGQSCGHFQRFSLESSLPLRKCREQWGYSPPIRSKSVSGHSGDLH